MGTVTKSQGRLAPGSRTNSQQLCRCLAGGSFDPVPASYPTEPVAPLQHYSCSLHIPPRPFTPSGKRPSVISCEIATPRYMD